MEFEREYADLAAVADASGSEAPTWTLTTAADRSLLFRIDIEPPFEATLAVGELGLWTLRLVVDDDDVRVIRAGMPGDYEGILRNIGLALLETGEELAASETPGDLEFIAAAFNWSLAVDQEPVVAASAEALGRILIESGNRAEGVELIVEYAIPAFRAIGQERHADELAQLAG